MAVIGMIAAGAAGALGSGIVGSLLGVGGPSGGGGGESAETIEANKKGLVGLDKFMADILSQTNDQYSKQAALSDTQGTVANLFREYSNTAVPQIFQMENTSGGYNSTTGQLMANDAFASTLSKAAAVQSEAILNYRKIQQGDYSTLGNLVASIRGQNAQNPTSSNASPLDQALMGIGGSLGSSIGANLTKPWAAAPFTPGPADMPGGSNWNLIHGV